GLGEKPSEAVVVEDALAGIEAAKAVGLCCVAVAHSYRLDKLRASPAALVVGNIAQIHASTLAALYASTRGEQVSARSVPVQLGGLHVGDGSGPGAPARADCQARDRSAVLARFGFGRYPWPDGGAHRKRPPSWTGLRQPGVCAGHA